MPILLVLTTTGCRTTKDVQKIEIPPKPQREEQKAPENIREVAELLNYYEHLVEEWELWGETVENLIEVENGYNPSK